MSRQTTKMLAAMALGKPLHKIEHVCDTQGAVLSSRQFAGLYQTHHDVQERGAKA